MEIGLVTDVFADKDLDGLLKTCSELRLKQLEFSCGNYTGGKFFNVDKMLNDDKHRDEIVDKIKDHNFKISALSCHGNPIAPGLYGKQHDEITRKTIKLASILKIDRIICLSGCAGGPGDSNPNWIVTAWPPERGKILEWQWKEVLVPYWKNVADYAENLGVKICFELHGGDMVYNVPTTHRIRDQASKNLGANFDPSHLIWMGGDPVQMVKNLGEAVFYVHIKDVKIDPVQKSLNTLLDTTWFADVNNRSWNFCIPGHGHDEKWWSEFLLALRSIGYEDVLSIEHEDCSLGRNEGMRLTIEFLERILINDIVDYEWSKEKINQLLELWKKGIPEEEVSKIDKN